MSLPRVRIKITAPKIQYFKYSGRGLPHLGEHPAGQWCVGFFPAPAGQHLNRTGEVKGRIGRGRGCIKTQGRRTIHKHIPSRGGERSRHAVEGASEVHLATKTRCVCKAERHVEHVVFVILSAVTPTRVHTTYISVPCQGTGNGEGSRAYLRFWELIVCLGI